MAASLDGRKNIPLPYCSTPCMAGRAPPPPADTPAPAACRAAAGAGPHTKRCSPIPPGRALGAGLQQGLQPLGTRESERKGPFGESKQAGLMGKPFLPLAWSLQAGKTLHPSLRPRPRRCRQRIISGSSSHCHQYAGTPPTLNAQLAVTATPGAYPRESWEIESLP